MVRAGELCHSQWNGRNKQEEKHELPFQPPLRASIDAWRAADPGEGHLVWLVSEWGAPYASTDTLAAWFPQQRCYAGITAGLSPHALRKLAAVRCVETGASEPRVDGDFRPDDIETSRPVRQAVPAAAG